MPEQITITALNTYPVKGLGASSHASASITSGQMLPHDREWAIEAGSRKFDQAQPAWLPKIAFAQRMSHEKLAELETEMKIDGTAAVLTIFRDGKQVSRGDLNTPIGRQLIEQFIAGFMKQELRGSPRIVSAGGHHFADVPSRFISIINLASLREVERVAGTKLDPLRFRANVHIEGAEPWAEFSWLGKTIEVDGQPALRVAERITRCAAISVNPQTAKRDLNLPRLLSSAFRHEDFGIYSSAIADAEIKTGQTITIA